MLLQAILTGVLMGLVFALIALGLSVIFGVMEFVNFAHGEFLLVGMYVAYVASVSVGLEPILSIPISAAVSALLSIATYHFMVRHVLRGPMIAQLFSTFGLMVFLQAFFLFVAGSNYRMVKVGWFVGKSVRLTENVVVDLSLLVAGILSIFAYGVVYYFFNHTRTGIAMQATALDRVGATIVGIPTSRMNYLAWGIGGGCVGMAGALLSTFFYIFPTVGIIFVMVAFATVALGGFGSITGVLLAGVLIGLIEVLGGIWIGPQFKFTLVYAVYLLIMVLRPKGLLGR